VPTKLSLKKPTFTVGFLLPAIGEGKTMVKPAIILL
jgi:hypothetical protein